MAILVIIPTYNERENIVAIVPAVFAANPEVNILVVDDNSPDGTGAAVESMQSQHLNKLHLLKRAGKEGLGKAYLAGFAWALQRGYEVVVEMDADFSHRPRDLTEILKAIRESDFVVGSRYVQGGSTVNWSLLRKVISRGGSLYARWILGFPLRDWTGGFNAWQRRVLQSFALDDVKSEGYSFQIELKYRALRNGFKPREVPIVFEDRRVGQSKMSLRIVLEAFYRVWTLRWLVPLLLLSMQVFAQPDNAKTAVQGQAAVVKVQEANIYTNASFDSPVMRSLPGGTKVRISKKIFGDYFLFYKVKLGENQYGYISDTDVEAVSDRRDMEEKAKKRKTARKTEAQKREEKEEEDGRPLLFRRYIGGSLARINFREEGIRGIDAKEDLWFYGVRVTGPDILWQGPVTDINVHFHYGAPTYYDKLSSSSPSGYIFLTDYLLVFPFMQAPKWIAYMEAGPLLTYSSFKVTQLGYTLNLTELNLGASFVAGAAYRWSKWVGRFEYKYMMEKSTHRGFSFSVQHQF